MVGSFDREERHVELRGCGDGRGGDVSGKSGEMYPMNAPGLEYADAYQHDEDVRLPSHHYVK